MPDKPPQQRRTNRIFKSLHKPLTYLGVERTLFYLRVRERGGRLQRVFVQKMKTKWGSCNPASRSVRLNTDLAKKPRECLEYILVHEMVHMLEPTHNAHFVAVLDQLLPQWRVCRAELNQLPVCHEKWSY